jgi:hypothetical protein
MKLTARLEETFLDTDRWTEAIVKLGRSRDVGSFSDDFEAIRQVLIESALKRKSRNRIR